MQEEGKFNDQARPRHKLQKDGTVATIDSELTMLIWAKHAILSFSPLFAH